MPAPDPAKVARIRAYLEQHRATYDRDALKAKLLADGHDPSVVEQAMREVYGEPGPAARVRRETLLVTILAVVGTVILNASLCVVGVRGGGEFGIFLPVLGVVAEGIVAAVLWRNRPAVARGLAWGIAISALIVVALIVIVLATLSGGFF